MHLCILKICWSDSSIALIIGVRYGGITLYIYIYKTFSTEKISNYATVHILKLKSLVFIQEVD